jgi:hypothetical protein
MVVITPGVDFIAHHLVNFSLPPALLVAAARYLAATHEFSVPTWVLVSGSILSVPLVSAARIIWKSFLDKRDAAAMGARLAPVIEGKSVGNLDVLSKMRHEWDYGYPGMSWLLYQPSNKSLTASSGWNGRFVPNTRACGEHARLVV